MVLPLLQTQVVNTGWVTNEAFLQGYGLAQAVPGPLFTFRCLSGERGKPRSERPGRRGDRACRHLPARYAACLRHVAVLGRPALAPRRPGCDAGCECGVRMRLWSASLGWLSTIRYGRAQSSRQGILHWL